MVRSSIVRDLTPLALGVGALFLISRSDLFNKVGGGVGNAVEGVGEGVADIGRSVGDVAQDVSTVTKPFASTFKGASDRITQEFEQSATRDQILEEERIRGALDRERIRQDEKTQRTGLLQSQFTQGVELVTSADDKVLSLGRRALSKVKQFAEVGSVVSFNPFTSSLLSGGVAKALVDSSGGITGRVIDVEPASAGILQTPAPASSLQSRRSGGVSSLQTLRPTAREKALKQSLPASTRNLPAMTPAPVVKKSIRSKFRGFLGKFF